MRLIRLTAVVAVHAAVALQTDPAAAQQPIRVVRHAPADTARSGDVVTVTFDRPITEAMERLPQPDRIVRIEPPLAATVEWRDPVTLRVVPSAPLVPSHRYTVTVDTTFEAGDGGRLAAAYRFTVVTRGPRLLAQLPLGSAFAPRFAPSGKATLLYSAPVDTAELSRTARLELSPRSETGCPARTVRFAAKSDRPFVDSDVALRNAMRWSGDTDARFHRVIELQAEAPLPEGCDGTWVIPSFDPGDRAEVRYRVATTPPFRILGLACTDDCAVASALRVTFSAPLSGDTVASHLRLTPAVPYRVRPLDWRTDQFLIDLPIRPRTTYRVTMDSTLTDIYGRRLTGSREVEITVRDRRPSLGHQLGFFTVSRQHPALRITHVNADSAEIVIVPVPDSLRIPVATFAGGPAAVAKIIGELPDTIHMKVPLRGAINEERITEVRIPREILDRYPGGLVAARARAVWRMTEATYGSATPGKLPTVQVFGDASPPLSNWVAIIQVTDLAAHAKVDAGGGAVFVTDVNDGRPVERARIMVRDLGGRLVATGTTDRTGVAPLQASAEWRSVTRESDDGAREARRWGYHDANARIIEVSRGSDRSLAIVPSSGFGQSQLDGGNVDRSYDRDRIMRAIAYTERPIYRPGERVYLGAIVREGWLGSLTPPPVGDSIRIRVTSLDDGSDEAEVARDTVIRLGEYGTIADSFLVSRTATLGEYGVSLEAVQQGVWRDLAWTTFRVAEYRVPEFRTSLTLDTSRTYFLGDTIRGRVSASYYFGAPMPRVAVSWRAVTSGLWGLRLPRIPAGFVVGGGPSWGANASPTDEVSGTDTLDATGSVSLTIPTTASVLSAPGKVDVEVIVEDLNRQTVTATASTSVHASSYYVAARDAGRDWYWRLGVPRVLEVLAVRPDGQRAAGVTAHVAVVRRRAAWVQQGSSDTPAMTWRADTVHRDSIVTADSVVRYRYTPASDGSHEVVFAIRDEAERPHQTTISRYVISSGTTYAWGQAPTALPVRLLADTVEAGDSAPVSVISPFPRAEAWITVEREGVLGERRLTIPQGESTVAIPTAEQFGPSAVVSVLLVNSGAAWRKDSVHQRVRLGRATLAVSPSSRRLTLSVETGKLRHEPGDSARLTVRLQDRNGHPVSGQVTIWGVDEGVLALADYTVPDPFAEMYDARGSGLSFGTTATTLASLARQREPNGWRIHLLGRNALGSSVAQLSEVVMTGMSTGTVLAALRSNFRTTPFFLSGLVADRSGVASATVKLPDNLTTFRVIAVAATRDSRFGSAETTLLLTKPLLARAALPRFVRSGDSLLAGAVLTNHTVNAIPVNVRASGRSIAVAGRGDDTRTLASGASAEVRFGWKAAAPPGDTAAFRFDVAGDGYADAVQTLLPVRAPYSPRFHTTTGVVRAGATVRMLLPPGLDAARSTLSLQIGTTPVPVVRSAYRRLDTYPYQCTEQLTSAGEVVVAMLRLQRAGMLDSSQRPTPVELRRKLQLVVDELSRRQTQAGGIGYWTPATWTNPRLSAYAGFLLLSARDLRIEVSPRVLMRLAEYMRDPSGDADWSVDTTYGDRATRARVLANHLADRLARVQYLRRTGEADVDDETRLIAAQRNMMWEDRVQLALVLAAREDRAEARAVLGRAWRDVELLGNRLGIPDSVSYSVWFPSPVRPVARLLRATLAIEPTHPGLPLLIERVVQQGRPGRAWMWNTHDYAAASEALIEAGLWQRTIANANPIVVRSAHPRARGRVLLRATSTMRADSVTTLDGLVERDGNWLAVPIRIEGADQAPIYYALTVSEIPISPPKTPDAKGIVVERWYERWEDGRPVTSVKEGELVRGRLRVTIPSTREYIAVEDLLPAGLEVVDLSLRTSSTLGPLESAASRAAEQAGERANRGAMRYGRWYDGWWSPWEHQEIRDDRVVYFARWLDRGTYTATYVARATTAGMFIRPPAHAEEMYNPALGGRSDGGVFVITSK